MALQVTRLYSTLASRPSVCLYIRTVCRYVPCSTCGHQGHISLQASPRAGCFPPWQHHEPSGSHSTHVHVYMCTVHGDHTLPVSASGDSGDNKLTEAVSTYSVQSCWVTAILLKEKLDHGEVSSFSSHTDRTRLLCLNCRDRRRHVQLSDHRLE